MIKKITIQRMQTFYMLKYYFYDIILAAMMIVSTFNEEVLY